MGLTELLGETLTGKEGPVATSSLEGNEVVGLYFSAHWCPPCRGYTPALVKQYEALKADGKKLEIVFVSSDKDEASFAEYYGEMPWLSLPFADRKAKEALSKEFKVSGIPTLVLLNGAGEVITKKGREAVMEPSKYPWIPPTLADILGGAQLVTKEGAATTLKDLQAAGLEHLMLYFSAHWCPPCRGFTPRLASTYAKLRERLGPKVECVFVSSDRDQGSFDEYLAEMPWAALKFEDRGCKDALSSYFEVQGIPSLVLLDGKTLETINADARGTAGNDPNGDKFPWVPPLVKELDEDPGELNDTPSVVVLAEKSEDAWDDLEEALGEVAAEAKASAGADDSEKVVFGICKEMGGVGEQIRKLTKVGSATKAPACVLLDLADQGGFYMGPSDISAASVRELVANFKAKSLPRLQVGA